MTEEHVQTSRPGLVLGVLALAGGGYALLQSLVVPALPVLQHDLHTTTAGVAWVLTAYLLAASVATPIAGRLGDLYGKKRVLVLVLAGLAFGSGLAGFVTTLPLMIVARTIQGLGGAIFPLAFGIIRDEFPRARVAGAIALISGILGIGGGLGIVLAGPILENLNYHWLFWIPLFVTLISMTATIVLIPESSIRAPGDVHWIGAILLSGWLVALLVAVSEAPTWGWGSPKTIGLLVLSVVIAVLWVYAELRSKHPLVDMTMMRLRGVWTTNLAAFLIGFGMYSAFILIPQYVQAPKSTGYGFGATVTEAGLFLIPTTVAMLIFSPLGGRLSTAVGSKVPLVIGTCVTVVSFVVLAASSAPRRHLRRLGPARHRRRLRLRRPREPDRRGRPSGPDRRRLRHEHDRPHDRRRNRRRGRRKHPRREPPRQRLPRQARLHGHLPTLRRRPRSRRRRLTPRPGPRQGESPHRRSSDRNGTNSSAQAASADLARAKSPS